MRQPFTQALEQKGQLTSTFLTKALNLFTFSKCLLYSIKLLPYVTDFSLFPTIIFTECLQVSFSHKRNFGEIWKAEMENILFYTLKVSVVPSAFALHIMSALLPLLLVLGQRLVGRQLLQSGQIYISSSESWASHVWSSIIKGTSLSPAVDRSLGSASGCSLAWKERWPKVWI